MAIKVSLRGLPLEDFHNTYLIKKGSGETTAAIAQTNPAMTIDTAAANQMKLAGAGDKINGRLEVYEDRINEGITVGTIARKGGVTFQVEPAVGADMPAIGDYLVGDTDAGGVKGFVRKASSAEIQAGKSNWQVMEVAADNLSVVAMDF